MDALELGSGKIRCGTEEDRRRKKKEDKIILKRRGK